MRKRTRSRLVFKSANIKRVVLILTLIGLIFTVTQQARDFSNLLNIPSIVLFTIIAIVVWYYGTGRDEEA